MKLFKNPELNKLFGAGCILSILACGLCFAWEARFGWLMLGVCALFLALFYISAYRRYQKISKLALDINKLLHGDMATPIGQYSEGELAILQSEVYKMTVRLREQQQSLQDDKVYLADSLADIAHQIRTPLTSINLLVSFLSEPNITEERQKKVSHDLYALLSRIDWLITSLLKISKLDAGTVRLKTEQLPLEELLRKAVSPILVPMELRDQQLQIEASGTFAGDIAWTCEAITNIVKNCMEHTPDGGMIAIQAEENALYSELVITDNGCGIAKEDLPHIFERFYKGKDSDQNSFGIGLALARMIVISQNGTVKAENNAQKGAKFTIRFYKGTV